MATGGDDDLHAALALFNRGEYLACQEALERLFADAEAGEQAFLRALIALSCGMHLHFHRGGGRGVENLFRQCLLCLDDFRPQHRAVQTGELFDAVEAYLEDLKTRRKPGAGFLDRWLAPRVVVKPGTGG